MPLSQYIFFCKPIGFFDLISSSSSSSSFSSSSSSFLLLLLLLLLLFHQCNDPVLFVIDFQFVPWDFLELIVRRHASVPKIKDARLRLDHACRRYAEMDGLDPTVLTR